MLYGIGGSPQSEGPLVTSVLIEWEVKLCALRFVFDCDVKPVPFGSLCFFIPHLKELEVVDLSCIRAKAVVAITGIHDLVADLDDRSSYSDLTVTILALHFFLLRR